MAEPATVKPRRRSSVRLQVTAVAAGVVALALVLGALLLVAAVRAGMVRSLSGSGPQQAAQLAAVAGRGPLPEPLPPVEGRRRTLLQVVGADGRVLTASEPLRGAPAIAAAQARRRIVTALPGAGAGPWLVEPAPATLAARPATVVVVTSLAEVDRSTRLLTGLMALGVPLLTGLVAVVVWFVVGRSLRPVEAMRREVDDITAHDLHQRISVRTADPEIQSLASTLNDLLARLEAARDRERRFLADASHELRTPVANIQAALDVAAAHPERTDWPAVAADLARQNERMARLTDDLLTLARSEDGRLPWRPETVDLAEVVTAELERPVPSGRSLEAVTPLPSVQVSVDRHHAGRVLTNLIDNGLRYASRRVTVSLTSGTRWAEITVSDDGPGVPRDERDRIFERFVRLDDHRSRDGGGAGLGLPIARLLVERNGGTIGVRDTGQDGASFVVRLPLATPGALSASS